MSEASPPAPEGAAAPGRLAQLLKNEIALRVLILVVLSALSGMLVVDYVRVPSRSFEVGDVADRDIRATTSFEFIDWDETLTRERLAEDAVLPVFDFDATLSTRLNNRLGEAFDHSRRAHAEALMAAKAAGRSDLTEAELSAIAGDFLRLVELSLDAEDLQRIIDARWSRDVENLARQLISSTMRSYVVADRSVLPGSDRTVNIVRILSDSRRDEVQLESFDQVLTPAEARQQVSLTALENGNSDSDEVRASVALARAAVRPNFSYNQLITEDRRQAAREGVSQVVIRISRGTALAREGDVLNSEQVERIDALQRGRSDVGFVGSLLAMMAFCALVWVSLYQFAASWIRKFTKKPGDLAAIGALALIALGLARLIVELSQPLTAALGLGLSPSCLWYLAPFAGSAMLVRILVNSETALVWVLGTACLLGVMMEQSVLFTLFFAISGLTAAGSLAHMRERVGVLRAGLLAGLVNAAAALLLGLVQIQLGEAASMSEPATQPLWDVGFAFAGGVLSGVFVLGVVPIFEGFGFVTDYRLLELANLNHPLLRQLMLRAPGTYHHSVTVAQLCEAAAEAISANALQTRVACYFHDIGKAVNPRYFIENQRSGPNPHDRLPPRTSARLIVNHVRDGEAIARQYKLPPAIIDGITMHHGSGLIQYFYAKAVEQAGPGEVVDEADFRYPGQPPNSRETGIMMLADKVEAACRTLKDKSPENIRALIQRLVNGAILDGQLEHCPLTVKELYTIVDAFTNTLMGIYHHRIEYPGVPKRRPESMVDEAPTGPIITLEMASNPLKSGHTDPSVSSDNPGSYTDPNLGRSGVTDPGAAAFDSRSDPAAAEFRPEDDYESAVHLQIPSWRREDDH